MFKFLAMVLFIASIISAINFFLGFDVVFLLVALVLLILSLIVYVVLVDFQPDLNEDRKRYMNWWELPAECVFGILGAIAEFFIKPS